MSEYKTEKMVLKSGKYTDAVRNYIKLTSSEKAKFESQMRRYAKNFLKMHFDLDLKVPIKIDGRLSRAGGSFHFRYIGKKRQSVLIKMSERFIALARHDKDGVQAILDILEHELVHYALFEQGSDEFSDGQEEFENTLAKLNIGASGATNRKKVKTKKQNVWYSMVDVYESMLGKHKVRHSKSEATWLGKRTGYEIVKSIW